jgi:hypothetical protein
MRVQTSGSPTVEEGPLGPLTAAALLLGQVNRIGDMHVAASLQAKRPEFAALDLAVRIPVLQRFAVFPVIRVCVTLALV